jgi:hypothetical protein
MTLLFLITTLFFLAGTCFFAKVIYFSIQEDQWLDSLFGWQKMLERVGNKSGGWNAIIYKALGGCQFCFSHFISLLTFFFYALVMVFCFHLWPSFDTNIAQILFSLVWYLIYVSTGTVLATLTITRL